MCAGVGGESLRVRSATWNRGGRPCQAGKSRAGVRCSFPERQAGGTGVCVSADDWVYGESVFGESVFGDWVFVSGCW